MKKLLLLLYLLLATITLNAQSMKMVVDAKGNVVGRYVRTNTKTYTVEVQDDYNVPKAGKKVVTYSAANGQGVIYCKDFGKFNVYATPSTSAQIIGHVEYIEGYVPETYPCLGKSNDWYIIKINGKKGYVKADLMEWDGMDTF